MKRHWFILLGGLLLALLAYGGSYLAGSANSRDMECSAAPELAWLQKEFHLSDAELTRIQALHQSYVSGCAERCERIDAKNAELQHLLATANGVTPEVARAVEQSAQLRAECQKAMLRHFYEVSQTMPPVQGRSYFNWVVGRTFGSEHASMIPMPSAAANEHHPE